MKAHLAHRVAFCLTFLSTWLSAFSQTSVFFRIAGVAGSQITSATPDGTITWSCASTGSACRVQICRDASLSNWVDYAQVLITNSISSLRVIDPNLPPGMAYVPAGTFTMGSFDPAGDPVLPVHTVYVSAFYMDRNLVTKQLWDQVATWAVSNGYTFEHGGLGKAAPHPAWMIWYDAAMWCNARSEMEGRPPAYFLDPGHTLVYRADSVVLQNDWVDWHAGYRLPTEAEWEKAARGGPGGHRFPWLNTETISHAQANYFSTNTSNYDASLNAGYNPLFNDGVLPYSSPAGFFAPNSYGLYDMSGNMWQWCWDWYDVYTNAAQIDPHGPDSGTYRIRRGGSWKTPASMCRVANRGTLQPLWGGTDVGFRCVLPAR